MSWQMISAIEIREGDFLRLADGLLCNAGLAEARVLEVIREETRIIIATTTWDTIKHPGESIFVKRNSN